VIRYQQNAAVTVFKLLVLKNSKEVLTNHVIKNIIIFYFLNTQIHSYHALNNGSRIFEKSSFLDSEGGGG